MKTFKVFWSKTYYVSGERYIIASSEKEAGEIVYKKIGDYEGSMQYNPSEDYVQILEEVEEKDLDA